MSINLNNIKPAKRSQKLKKRVGRGNASGHGTYATRGLKGQNSRSGASGLKRIGMKSMLRSTPKLRGFKTFKPKAQVVTFKDLNNRFINGAVVTPASLFKSGLIASKSISVKVLGGGKLKRKNLKFIGIKLTASVREALEKQSGKS